MNRSRNAAKRDQRSDPPHDQLGERPDLIGTGVAFSSSNTHVCRSPWHDQRTALGFA